MIDPKDFYRAAHTLIRDRGSKAKDHAMLRLLELREVGDEHGHAAWMSILNAILVLEAKGPPDEQVVH